MPQIITNIRINAKSTREWKVCQPTQHSTLIFEYP